MVDLTRKFCRACNKVFLLCYFPFGSARCKSCVRQGRIILPVRSAMVAGADALCVWCNTVFFYEGRAVVRCGSCEMKGRRAWALAQWAENNKKIVRPKMCPVCGEGSRKREDVVAHHEDYDKPLDITWCCHRCHKKMHLNRVRLRHGIPLIPFNVL